MSKRKATPQKKAGKSRRRPVAGMTVEQARTKHSAVLEDTEGLDPQVYEFAVNYLANGFNATQAYLVSHPEQTNVPSARVLAHRLLMKDNTKAFIRKRLESRWKPLHMSGDEALARVAIDASIDPRLLFDEKGKPLEPHLWSDDIANSVESVKVKPDGTIEVKFTSKAGARRTILEIAGKVKGASGGIDDLAAALRETLDRHTKS